MLGDMPVPHDVVVNNLMDPAPALRSSNSIPVLELLVGAKYVGDAMRPGWLYEGLTEMG
jgi:hypothetical protein